MQFELQNYLQVSMVISFFRQLSKKQNETSFPSRRRRRRCCRLGASAYQGKQRLSFDPNEILLLDL